jgi:hypothetical protein
MEKFDRNKYFQGKSKENYETSASIVFWCAIALSVIATISFFVKFF